MSRRRRHPAHVNHERWLVSYADFITLLFAFFVVLYSSSQVDTRKISRLSVAIQAAFQQLGALPGNSLGPPIDTASSQPMDRSRFVEKTERKQMLGRFARSNMGTEDRSRHENFDELRGQVEKALAPEIRRNEVALRIIPDGLVISLREVGFFDSGSAKIKARSQDAFARIAEVLSEHTYNVRIEGHTDNVPIHTSQFDSNWELSTARASDLLKKLVEQYKFPAERFSIAGYAEFHPIASNGTAEGRQSNRRVDIVVLSSPPAEKKPAVENGSEL